MAQSATIGSPTFASSVHELTGQTEARPTSQTTVPDGTRQSTSGSQGAPQNQTFSYPETQQFPAYSAPTPQGLGEAHAEQAPQESEPQEWFPNAKRAWFKYYNKHRNQVVFATVGLLLGAGLLIIGFWPTLLLAVLITIGVLYGRYKDGDPRMMITVKNVIDRLD